MRILITGSNSVISQSIKNHLEKNGHQVFLTSSTGNSNSIPFDLLNPNLFENEMNRFLEEGIDVLILSAATPTYKLLKLDAISTIDAEKFILGNILGNHWLLKKTLQVFKKNNFGRIIFLSSMLTEVPMKGYSIYSAAKSGLETLIKYTAHEYGSFNINANTIRLGVFHTDRNDKYLKNEETRKKIESSVALKRLGNTKDLNPVIDMLIDSNCFVQGSVIDVAGGPLI